MAAFSCLEAVRLRSSTQKKIFMNLLSRLLCPYTYLLSTWYNLNISATWSRVMNPVSLGSRSYKRCVNQLISKNLTKSSHQIFHSISRFSSAPSSGASHGMPSLLCVFLSCVWEMFKVKCDTFPVNMTPLPMCNSMLTTRSAHNSGLDIDKPSH